MKCVTFDMLITGESTMTWLVCGVLGLLRVLSVRYSVSVVLAEQLMRRSGFLGICCCVLCIVSCAVVR